MKKKHKPQIVKVEISAAQTTQDKVVIQDISLDSAYERVVGVSVIQATKSFDNFSGDSSEIGEIFELTLNHQSGEIFDSVPLDYLQFDKGCPLDSRFFYFDPQQADGKRIDISLKKLATAKDQNGGSIDAGVNSNYLFYITFLLTRNDS